MITLLLSLQQSTT